MIYWRFPFLVPVFTPVFFALLLLFFSEAFFDLGGNEAPYSRAFWVHEANLPWSFKSAGGTTTYSRMGRPGIGSKIRAPLVFSNAVRASSGSRRIMSS